MERRISLSRFDESEPRQERRDDEPQDKDEGEEECPRCLLLFTPSLVNEPRGFPRRCQNRCRFFRCQDCRMVGVGALFLDCWENWIMRKLQIHTCESPGLTMEGPVVTEHRNYYGQHWFEAVSQIGTIFGAEVHGEIKGIGATQEIALQRLESERARLYETIWL